jgi:hypothetical protein
MTDLTDFLAAWTDAERSGDTAFLAERLTGDFVGIGPFGFALTKPAWLARHRAGDLRYDTFALDELDVRSHGPVTVVTARQTARGTFAGRPLPEQLRDTIVVVHDGRPPRLAALHMSFIAGTPGAPAATSRS